MTASAERKLTPQQQVLLSWKLDPVLFVMEAFASHWAKSGDSPDVWQLRELKAAAVNDRIAIRSGHGVGKTAWLTWLILWWLLTRFPTRVACTAPTSSQLEVVLWGEIAIWLRRLPEGLRSTLEYKSEQVVLVGAEKESFAVARTARREQPEAFQGFHSPNMLFIVDEASGVDDIIFEVGEGSMSTQGAKTVMVGNPTRTSGYFYDAFHKNKGLWHTARVSCLDAKLVSKAQIERYKNQYGQDSNIYRVRVLGEFPYTEDDSVIPLYLCEAAVLRDVEPIDTLGIWGLDVARFGDDASALAKRQGNLLVEPVKQWKGKDTMQLAGLVANEFEEARLSGRKPGVIYVDSIGLGAGVADRLDEIGIPCMGINVAESAAVGEKFLRLRDELWWKGREWFRGLSCKIPDDGYLIGELAGPKYSFTSSGKIKVESKDEMKKRGLPSPNRADAFLMTFAGPGTFRASDNVSLEPEVFPDT